MERIANALLDLQLGEGIQFGELEVFPVSGGLGNPPELIDLDSALKKQLLEITEVSEGGSVPHLKVTNSSNWDVIIYDGEELIGAKQNRVINVTVVVGALTTIILPVTCVEQGRWSWKSRNFSSGKDFAYPSLRRAKFAQVSENMRAGTTLRADQGAVWQELSAKASRLGVCSSTGAMKDISEKFAVSDKELEERFQHGKGQIGYIAFIRGGFAGGDVFSSPEICSRKLHKLLRGYHLDSLDRESRFPTVGPTEILRGVQSGDFEQVPSVGEGREHRFKEGMIQGAATLLGDSLVHLVVFPRTGSSRPDPRRWRL
jgi:hypothetical protein